MVATNRSMRFPLSVGVLAAFLAAGEPAQAREGATPIYEPTVVSTPGHYLVTRDISGIVSNGSYNATIHVNADDVLLDLGGHQLTTTQYGIIVRGTNVRVKNGSLLGGGSADGIGIIGRNRTLRVANVVFGSFYQGISTRPGDASARLRVDRCTFWGITYYAVRLFASVDDESALWVRDSSFFGPRAIQHASSGTERRPGVTVAQENTIVGPQVGVWVDGESCRATGNTMYNVSQHGGTGNVYGIICAGIVERNVIDSMSGATAFDYAIRSPEGGRIQGNAVNSCSGCDGIVVNDVSVVSDNVVYATRNGIEGRGGTLVDGNAVSYSENGIRCRYMADSSAGATFLRGNTVTSSGTYAVTGDNVPVGISDGVFVGSGAGSYGALLQRLTSDSDRNFVW